MPGDEVWDGGDRMTYSVSARRENLLETSRFTGGVECPTVSIRLLVLRLL